MELKHMDAALLKRCFLAAAKNLENNKEYINELNVFPVPDGDTGTNMTMTIVSAAKAVSECPDDMGAVCHAISQGSLRGARGNSGVILSQLLRGFTKAIREHEEIDSSLMAAAFKRAVETAYKAVMKPKEGTILTVAKGMSEKASELCEGNDDLLAILEETVRYGDEVLQRTPDMLPVLKEAGVVDSGGEGLMTAMKGALRAILSPEESYDELFEASEKGSSGSEGAAVSERKAISTDDIKFGYCTEFIINLERPMTEEEEADFKSFLESIGDSIVCVADEEMVKVHVHTNHPGQAFEKGLCYGSLSRMKVDNMREEHEEKLIKDASRIAAEAAERKESEKAPELPSEHKENGFVTVCAGAGLSEIFKGLGADYVIEGGQTMNPSTEDILEAVEKVNADNIFVLPNNKNIILAAEQAAKIADGKNITVINTKTVPQGISAIIGYGEAMSPEENKEAMEEAAQSVKTGQVTYAVRNTSALGKEIKEGDIMGIGDRGILAVGEILNPTTLDMLKAMVDEDSELITVYRGEDVKEEDAEALCEDIRNAFPECEVELQYGGQPVYYYIVSVE